MSTTRNGTHALYRHFDALGALLYVGIAHDPFTRLTIHLRRSHWFADIAYVTIEHFPTAAQARQAERDAIASEGPAHNVELLPPRSRPVERLGVEIANEVKRLKIG